MFIKAFFGKGVGQIICVVFIYFKEFIKTEQLHPVTPVQQNARSSHILEEFALKRFVQRSKELQRKTAF